MVRDITLMQISQVDELYHDDFCPIHGYLCSRQIFCWQEVIAGGEVVFCDENEETPILYDQEEDEYWIQLEREAILND